MHRVAHSVRGRLRVRYPPPWFRERRTMLEQRLRAMPGVRAAHGSDLTGSLLIDYDPFSLAEKALFEALDVLTEELTGAPRHSPAASAKVDIRRAPLLTLLGTTSVLGLACLPVPPPILAGLVIAGGLPTFSRAAST